MLRGDRSRIWLLLDAVMCLKLEVAYCTDTVYKCTHEQFHCIPQHRILLAEAALCLAETRKMSALRIHNSSFVLATDPARRIDQSAGMLTNIAMPDVTPQDSVKSFH